MREDLLPYLPEVSYEKKVWEIHAPNCLPVVCACVCVCVCVLHVYVMSLSMCTYMLRWKMGFVCHGGPPSLIACAECKGGQEQRRVGGTALLMYCFGNGTTTIPLHVTFCVQVGLHGVAWQQSLR